MATEAVLSTDVLNGGPSIAAEKSSYSVSIGYLRAFVTLLVVAQHAALAPIKPDRLLTTLLTRFAESSQQSA